MASNRRSSIGGRLRGLIPFRRRQAAAPQAPDVVPVKSLAVRPPWWRMAVQRLVGGLLPGFRSGSFPAREAPAEPAYPPERPLLTRRVPLTGNAKGKVIGGSTEHLVMAPSPGVAGSLAAVVQREAASIVVPPARPLVRPATVAGSGGGVRKAAGAPVSGPVANSPGAITAAAHTLAAQKISVQKLSAQKLPAQTAAGPASAAGSPASPLSSGLWSAGTVAPGPMSPVSPSPISLPVGSLSVGPLSAAQSLAVAAQSTPAIPGQSAAQPAKVPSPTAQPSVMQPLFAARSVAGRAASPQPGPMSLPGRPLATAQASDALGQPPFAHAPMSMPTAAPRSLAAAEVAERPASPEQRWRAAIASVPLESPKPFPTSMRPLVAQLTGSADGASYTTGPATRRALAEVGALGATTGKVVHLAQQPSQDPASLGVLAHELTHARSPVTRPRFMLHSHTGSMDSDERQARTVGSQFESVAPMRVQRLFGGGLPSVGGLTNQATGMAGGLANSATSAIGSGASELSSAAGGMSERFSSAASGFANRMGEEAGSVSAGLIDSLPVGGGANGVVGAVSQIARTVVDNAVREATQGAISEANQAVSQMSQAAQGMVSQAQGMATDGVNGLAGQANQWVNGAMTQATGAVQDLGNQAMGAVGDAQNAVGGLAGQAMGAAGQVLGPGARQALSGVDLDRIAEALEERLLRQLERRGGRYAGVF
ncbi:DUF4157 domain-containing protein [Kibdelosporangium persicum]|uniref:eCIS core domain-containing protein n=1 Tax=Kibdelosporangium persicum TaxID=2698649 RepID=A0ABX2EYM5_9PSEU|nr:DUF4157 domain-containing protein [Kibdelosporangium persicum]NRN64114.1 hypothetical protein [Kibdelosporangium persicum]